MHEVSETYVVAVSGGVDSVVLLDMLVNRRLPAEPNYQLPTTNYQLVVAHVDHGIRDDSAGDADFVRTLAEKYDLEFECYQAELGADASEAEAREVRYNFLRQCCKKHKASNIITAHHQNDLIETAVLNLLRGTGWRGLATMQASDIIRPLLNIPKSELVAYAKNHQLEWREDSTNQNQDYLRNYIRYTLLPAAQKNDSEFQKKLLGLVESTLKLRPEIEAELKTLIITYHPTSTTYIIPRYQLIMWPENVSLEVIYTILTLLDPEWHPSRTQLKKALLFSKTALVGKTLEVAKSLQLHIKTEGVLFELNT